MQHQILTGFVALDGDRNHVVFRGTDNPMTYSEVLVLRAIHGGDGAVTELVELRREERDNAEEVQRMSVRYGREVLSNLFPMIGGKPGLVGSDDSLPTAEEQAELEAKLAEVREAQKSKPKGKGKAAAAVSKPADVPALDNLPTT